MKGIRAFLFLSPILLFVPSLLPEPKSVGMMLVFFFYSKLLGFFPWNVLMFGLCYPYAKWLGREAWLWSVAAFAVPPIVPCVLAFMPAKFGSPADMEKQMKPVKAKAAGGSFSERFPLLERCFVGKPADVVERQRALFMTVQGNVEFLLPANPAVLQQFAAEATVRKFTVWAIDSVPAAAAAAAGAGDAGITAIPNQAGFVPVFGVGLVAPKDNDATATWLVKACAPGEKLTIAWHTPELGVKFSEFYPA